MFCRFSFCLECDIMRFKRNGVMMNVRIMEMSGYEVCRV